MVSLSLSLSLSPYLDKGCDFLMCKWLQDTVMLGADFYETDAEIATLLAEGGVPIGIGENTNMK